MASRTANAKMKMKAIKCTEFECGDGGGAGQHAYDDDVDDEATTALE